MLFHLNHLFHLLVSELQIVIMIMAITFGVIASQYSLNGFTTVNTSNSHLISRVIAVNIPQSLNIVRKDEEETGAHYSSLSESNRTVNRSGHR